MIIASKAQRRKQGSRAHKHQSAQKLERERERESHPLVLQPKEGWARMKGRERVKACV